MERMLFLIVIMLAFFTSCKIEQDEKDISSDSCHSSSKADIQDYNTHELMDILIPSTYENSTYPTLSVVEQNETNIVYRFNILGIKGSAEKFYWMTNISVPIAWKDEMLTDGDDMPLEILPFNKFNSKTTEEIFSALSENNESRKRWGDVYEEISLIMVGDKNFVRIVNSAFPVRYDPDNIICIGGPHYCIYFGTFEDDGELYAWQAVFYLPEVDPETCVTKEVLEEQEKILSTFEVVGKVK